ncbi:hypothetical protein [Nocardia sp. NPDC057455]|uniref:hypothetical protein n=1 Tax=Nocardia sp. NPDC057455 TaxID=3346138 RepID=UPI00366D86D0
MRDAEDRDGDLRFAFGLTCCWTASRRTPPDDPSDAAQPVTDAFSSVKNPAARL